MINDYLIYVILAITITAVPGPAVVLTIKNSLRYGYKVSIANVVGNFTAMIILASLSALGLGAIILASTMLFTTVKILGCVYLVYLGVKMWNSKPFESKECLANNRGARSSLSVFKEGFYVGISNPKAIVFFTALFPQFIDSSRAYIPQFITLIMTIEGISFLILMSYAFFSSMASTLLSQEKSMKLFNKLTGGAFVGFGVALLFKEEK